jgi:eukaryotic-like serine/threonine-protein kinase
MSTDMLDQLQAGAGEPEPSPLADAAIGPYVPLRSLGRGGMAEVFLVRHRHLGHLRALKVLVPELTTRADITARLLNEACATSQLRHPSIVEIFDCDVLPRGGAYIVMEYLEGQPLSQWLERVGPLASEPRLAAAIAGQIADGLRVAHEHGIVHRDLKPDNLFLVPVEGQPGRFSVKILDFGVAKLMGVSTAPKTRLGYLIGTPCYMAPEQCVPAGQIDPRSDVYALGCLLFELLCGRPPFIHHDTWEILRAQVNDPPPAARALKPSVPRALDALLARMLAKSPAARPQRMAEVIRALEGFLGYPLGEWGHLLMEPRGSSAVAAAPATQRSSAVPGSSSEAKRRGRRGTKAVVLAGLAALAFAAGVTGARWLGRSTMARMALGRAIPVEAPPAAGSPVVVPEPAEDSSISVAGRPLPLSVLLAERHGWAPEEQRPLSDSGAAPAGPAPGAAATAPPAAQPRRARRPPPAGAGAAATETYQPVAD